MHFKKGSEVEVLEKGCMSLGSWRPARILSGNGRVYEVKYDGCDMETTMLLNKVPRKMLRPVPPPAGLKSLACGDAVEVFDNGSWKLAQVMKLCARSTVIMGVLGSLNIAVVPLNKLRMAQTWKDNCWVAFEKESLKSEDVHVNEQSKDGRLNNQIPLSTAGTKTCGQLNPFAENYGDFVDHGYQEYIGRTNKKLLQFVPPVNENVRVYSEKKGIMKKARIHRPNKQNVTHQLLEKVDGVDSPDCFYGKKRKNTDLNHDLSRLCPIGIKCQKTKADAASNIPVGLDHSYNGSAASSVGSCSVTGFPNRPVCHKAANLRHEFDSDFEDAGSCCGSSREPFCFVKETVPEVIRSLELHAYRSTLRLLFAYGSLSWEQELLLTNLRCALKISNDEHLLEIKQLMACRSWF